MLLPLFKPLYEENLFCDARSGRSHRFEAILEHKEVGDGRNIAPRSTESEHLYEMIQDNDVQHIVALGWHCRSHDHTGIRKQAQGGPNESFAQLADWV